MINYTSLFCDVNNLSNISAFLSWLKANFEEKELLITELKKSSDDSSLGWPLKLDSKL